MEGRITNNSYRDIKRNWKLSKKKCVDLSELDVPIGVVYFIKKCSDPRITNVIERHKEEILQSPEWLNGEDYSYKSGVMLGPLPAPLTLLNGTMMKKIIRWMDIEASGLHQSRFSGHITYRTRTFQVHHQALNENGMLDLEKIITVLL